MFGIHILTDFNVQRIFLGNKWNSTINWLSFCSIIITIILSIMKDTIFNGSTMKEKNQLPCPVNDDCNQFDNKDPFLFFGFCSFNSMKRFKLKWRLIKYQFNRKIEWNNDWKIVSVYVCVCVCLDRKDFESSFKCFSTFFFIFVRSHKMTDSKSLFRKWNYFFNVFSMNYCVFNLLNFFSCNRCCSILDFDGISYASHYIVL